MGPGQFMARWVNTKKARPVLYNLSYELCLGHKKLACLLFGRAPVNLGTAQGTTHLRSIWEYVNVIINTVLKVRNFFIFENDMFGVMSLD